MISSISAARLIAAVSGRYSVSSAGEPDDSQSATRRSTPLSTTNTDSAPDVVDGGSWVS